ncbi:MAG: hypothetical protein LQ352_004260 [Teloschistes flavicans]|nr:MAG: hypothetical protein LQ352_004260 [Teloschistes flavicans]
MAPAATSSPVLANSKRSWHSPSFAPNSFRKKVNTAVPLTITPATAVSPNISSTPSPANTSIPSSPDGFRPYDLSSSHPPTPLQLPESTMAIPFAGPTPSATAMTEALSQNKSTGLLRRVSKGAKDKTNRIISRRQSSNNITNRDRSCGPIVSRRRSGSKTGPDGETTYIDPGFDGLSEQYLDDALSTHGPVSDAPLESGMSTPNSSRTQGGLAPFVDAELRQGEQLIKVTKRKQEPLRFILDTNSGKVTWNPSNPSKCMYIDDIQQIRVQGEAKNYREECQVSPDLEPLWFTIIYTDQTRTKERPLKTIHLIAQTPSMFNRWTTSLNRLSKYRHDSMAGLAGFGQDENILWGHWMRELTSLSANGPYMDEGSALNRDAIAGLCRRLHIHCSPNRFRAQFEKADVHGTGTLDFSEFQDLIRRLKEREEFKTIHESISCEDTDAIGIDEFLQFLQQVQGVEVDSNRAFWEKVFADFARSSKTTNHVQNDANSTEGTSMHLSLSGLSSFLCSTYNSIYNNVHPITANEARFVRPLNEYFISSSHNTYLLGRQVAGSSSTEAYVKVLQQGCRCVEIDCWDGTDGRPIVLHGRTMTSSILFADCITVISENAFVSSQYPLLLSLEVHCNPTQQQAMVDIMVKELGERLVREPLVVNALHLPSPEELKNRILVKVKAGPDPSVSGGPTPTLTRRERSLSSPYSKPVVVDNSSVLNSPMLSRSPSTSPPEHASTWAMARGSFTATSISSATDDSDAAGDIRPAPTQKSTGVSKIIKSLGDLGVYARGLKFRDFQLEESQTPNHIFSFNEKKFNALCRDQYTKGLLEAHNMRHLMRVYPSFRPTSSNPDPLLFWRKGVQMVALNWQTYDLPMQLNHAMFASGPDSLGYVLKPRELRQSLEEHTWESPGCNNGKVQKKVIKFSVDMISAQQLPRPRNLGDDASLNPYVEIEMISAEDRGKDVAHGEGGQNASARNGMSGIGLPHRRRSSIAVGHSFSSLFRETFRLQVETRYPSLVFIRWIVWNSQDGRNYNSNGGSAPLAIFTAKLSSLEQGYRHLPLFDHNGNQFLLATLFCKIKKEALVTVEREAPTEAKTGRFRSIGGLFNLKRTSSVGSKTPPRDFLSRKSSTKEDQLSLAFPRQSSSKEEILPTRTRKSEEEKPVL